MQCSTTLLILDIFIVTGFGSNTLLNIDIFIVTGFVIIVNPNSLFIQLANNETMRTIVYVIVNVFEFKVFVTNHCFLIVARSNVVLDL